MKLFYRVCSPETKQGLWYDQDGNFTGLIHDKFDFCMNSNLKMDYDKSIVGWLSVVENIEDLYKWFSKEDILKLQKENFFIHEYQSNNYRFYEKFQHIVINQKTAKIIKRIEI